MAYIVNNNFYLGREKKKKEKEKEKEKIKDLVYSILCRF